MEIEIKTSKREEILDITDKVKKIIENNAKEKSQACLVYTPHTSCSIIINENHDKSVCNDILEYLKKSIPRGQWEHDRIDRNADAHIKSSLIGPSQVVPIENKKLVLGRWQGIGLAEFDGPRNRRIIIKIL